MKGESGENKNQEAMASAVSNEASNATLGGPDPAMNASEDLAKVEPSMSPSFESTVPERTSAEPISTPAEEQRQKPAVEEHVVKRTSEGRAADTTVKRGASSREQLGNSISIAVQTRGAVDVQHSYLRFDLKETNKRLKDAAEVALILAIPGDSGAVGSQVRVYGVPEQVPDNWPEVGPRSLNWDNSISNAGLDSMPLLAEVTLTGREANQLRISDPRMTEFVRSIGEEFVSFVLAGGAPENKPLHFVSREGSSDQAPTLEFDILENNGKKE
jgi:hypothetical protein